MARRVTVRAMEDTATSAADWKSLAERLASALHLSAAPIFLAFSEETSPAPAFDKPMSPPAEDGRQGRVPPRASSGSKPG